MSNFRDFPGTISNFISVTPPAEVTVAGPWTFGAWVRPDVNTGARVILRLGPADNAPTRGFMFYLNGLTPTVRAVSNNFAGTTPLTEDVWNRVGITKVNSGVANINHILNGVANGGANADQFVALNGTTDPFQIGGTAVGGLGFTYFDGGIAWAFWLNGVTLSAAALDAYLNDPQSLIDDYGPSGTVTANALKIFWPMQCDTATEEDESGVGNNGTRTGTVALVTTGGPTPSSEWDPCALPGPTIDTQPQDQTVLLSYGNSASVSVEATGEAPLEYAWEFDGAPVGTDSPNLTLSGLTLADDGKQGTVTVSDVNGDTESNPFTITVREGDALSALSGELDGSGENATQFTSDAPAGEGVAAIVRGTSGSQTERIALRPEAP